MRTASPVLTATVSVILIAIFCFTATTEAQPTAFNIEATIQLVHELDNYGRDIPQFKWEGHLKRMKKAVEKGADPNARSSSYWTFLMAAAVQGDLVLIKWLVAKEVNIHVIGEPWLGEEKYGPLPAVVLAGANCHLDVVKFLLEKEAYPKNRRLANWLYIEVAECGGAPDLEKYLSDKGVIR